MEVKKVAVLFKKKNERVPFEVEAHHLERIKNMLPNAEIIHAHEEEELLAKTTDADVLLTWGLYKPIEFCRGAKSLKWIHTISAGVDGVMTPEISGLDIKISSTKGIHGIPIANQTLAYMLSFVRQFPLLFRQQQNKIWDKNVNPDEIWKKTVGIVGLGSIGEEIARQCKALDMRVIATKRTPTECEWIDHLYPSEQLEGLLSESDFVVVAVPLTPATRGYIGEKELRMMKQSAYLINIARGGVIDEAALINVLQEGRIAGAGLDVFEEEPLPPESPLWEMPNVIITPHMAADSPMYMDRAIEVFGENVKRFIHNEKLLYEVDKVHQY